MSSRSPAAQLIVYNYRRTYWFSSLVPMTSDNSAVVTARHQSTIRVRHEAGFPRALPRLSVNAARAMLRTGLLALMLGSMSAPIVVHAQGTPAPVPVQDNAAHAAPPTGTDSASAPDTARNDGTTSPGAPDGNDPASAESTHNPPGQDWRERAARITEDLRGKAGELGEELRKGSEKMSKELVRGARNAREFASDAWISTQIKAALVADESIKALDVYVTTADGIVQLDGVVDTPQQLERVEQIVRGIRGVKGVENRLIVRQAGS